jgi:ribosome-associated translation inhibitor RaiA
MRGPERRRPGSTPLSPEERRRLTRAAALRPINVLMLVIGTGIFATTLAWWIPPLTLITYAALVLLAARDPFFQRRVLHGSEGDARPLGATGDPDVSPERRARWLPRGESREKVEAALVVYRKVVSAVEESDDVTRAVLDDAVPKLHTAANRLVDVAQSRERAAEAIRDLRQNTGASAGSKTREESLRALEDRLRAADAEISDTFEKLLTLRARVARVSIEGGASDQAAALNASLEELNARLEALSETMSPPEAPAQER